MILAKNYRSLFWIGVLLILTIPVNSDAQAHSMFNSAEQTIGSYRVQVATLPEFPNVDEPSQVLFRVTDRDYNEVERFTMGIRIFFNEYQIDAVTPKSHQDGHWQMEYIFKNTGNHIFKVDLYDMDGKGGMLTYTFNMSTQSPFGYIFVISITIGALTCGIVLGYIYLPKKLRFKSKS